MSPQTPTEFVLTFFWVDDFDLKTDTQYGGGSINITTLMAFQEGRAENLSTVHVPAASRSSRQLSSEEHQVVVKKFDPKVQSPQIMDAQIELFSFNDKEFKLSFFTWVVTRKENSFDQIVPTISAHQLNNRTAKDWAIRKKIEMYLSPINSKVSHFYNISKITFEFKNPFDTLHTTLFHWV